MRSRREGVATIAHNDFEAVVAPRYVEIERALAETARPHRGYRIVPDHAACGLGRHGVLHRRKTFRLPCAHCMAPHRESFARARRAVLLPWKCRTNFPGHSAWQCPFV